MEVRCFVALILGFSSFAEALGGDVTAEPENKVAKYSLTDLMLSPQRSGNSDNDVMSQEHSSEFPSNTKHNVDGSSLPFVDNPTGNNSEAPSSTPSPYSPSPMTDKPVNSQTFSAPTANFQSKEHSVPDNTGKSRGVKSKVATHQLDKKLFEMALRHLSILHMLTKDDVNFSNIKKVRQETIRYIDTLASGIIGKK